MLVFLTVALVLAPGVVGLLTCQDAVVHVQHFGTAPSVQAYSNWTEFYLATMSLAPLTPVPVRFGLAPSHPLGSTTLSFMLRSHTSDFAVMEQHLCGCDFCSLHLHLPLERHSVANILDLGGNCGLAATVMSMVYPKARIVSVEPGASSYQLLAVNTAHNPRIQAVYGAAWNSTTLITMSGAIWNKTIQQEASDWATAVGPLTRDPMSISDVIPAWSVDDLMQKYHMPYVDILKVDVEGTEAVLFRDARAVQWLRRVRCLVTEWHHRYLKAKAYDAFKNIMAHYGLHRVSDFGEHEAFCRPAERERNGNA